MMSGVTPALAHSAMFFLEPYAASPSRRSGVQYTSHDFRRAVPALGIDKHKFIWKNALEQNGHVELFHKILKKEYIWPHEFANYQETEKIIAEAIADYNKEQIHSSIGYMTPAEFAKLWEMTNK